jgi:hypothetical protein
MGQTLEALDSVMARLKDGNPDLAVEYFPDDPDTYQLTHPKGALLVSYPGADFGESVDAAIVVQERDLAVAITLLFRQLNGRDGAVERLDLLRRQLVGFAPEHCRKMTARKEKFLQQKSGVWYYAALFGARTVQAECAEEEGGPPAAQITFLPRRD